MMILDRAYKNISFALILIIIAISSTHPADAAFVNVRGWVFYHNGTPVPAGTSVNITQTVTGWNGFELTGGLSSNYYDAQGISASNDGSDVLSVFSWLGVYNGSDSNSGLGWITINITYNNIVPRFNGTLPDLTMDEDNATGIDNAIDLLKYSFDYDATPMTYSIYSQSNSGLTSASIDGNYIDISPPAADQSGTNDVCVRAWDGENYSSQSCFTITVNAVADRPDFSSATDNVTGIVKGGNGVRITTTASDVDGDLIRLYVCDSPNVDVGGCVDTQRCTDIRATNPYCTFTAESDILEHSWYAFIYDATGLIASDNYTSNYTTDGSVPVPGSVVIENGDTYVSDTDISFTWSGYSDTGSGIRYYYYSFSDNSGTTSGTRVSNSTFIGQLTGASQGNITIYVWAEDFVGNIGLAASDTIIVDTEPPVLWDWTEDPVDLDENTTGDFTVTVRVNDTTWNSSDEPRLRFQYNSNGYYAWQDMTSLGGNRYSYVISEPINGWDTYVGDWLYYQVEATDIVGLTTTQTMTEYIDRYNNAPVLVNIPNQIIGEGENLSFIIEATDLDDETLYFSSDHPFNFIRLSDNSTIAWWVPTSTYAGTNLVTFSVTDTFESDSQSISIDVTWSNDPPVLSPVGNLYAYEHVPFLHYLYGYDPDNQNNYSLDNNLLIFDKIEANRWFRIFSYFNVTNQSYYGAINFTPLLSHRGRHNFTIYVSDGSEIDSENITFTVGYCGDVDAGGDPWCDENYESCITCSEDCGPCSEDEEEFMTIIIDPRNCLGRNFTIWTYMLYDRASCETEGLIVEGKEVCGNLSNVRVDIMILENRRWEKVDNFISDRNGEITFVTTIPGEYKLTATKSGYPNAYEYLEIGSCIEDQEEEAEEIPINETEEEPEEEKPEEVKEPEEVIEGEEEPSASTFTIILYYVIIPTLFIILIVLGYYYYDKEKNNVAWILKARIWTMKKYKKTKKKINEQYRKLMNYLGYDK